MPHYSTSQEAMATGASRVEAATTEIQSHLSALRREVETMMGGWRGEAAASFVQVHEAFESQADRINGALRRMHEALVATHRIYGNQETSQAHTLTGLAGRING